MSRTKAKRQPRLADHSDRFALQAEAHMETQAIIAQSRLWMVRDDFVDLLAARCMQLSERATLPSEDPAAATRRASRTQPREGG